MCMIKSIVLLMQSFINALKKQVKICDVVGTYLLNFNSYRSSVLLGTLKLYIDFCTDELFKLISYCETA